EGACREPGLSLGRGPPGARSPRAARRAEAAAAPERAAGPRWAAGARWAVGTEPARSGLWPGRRSPASGQVALARKRWTCRPATTAPMVVARPPRPVEWARAGLERQRSPWPERPGW